MASEGFLITDEWVGRKELFIDGEDLIVFKDEEDLNKKIQFYLQNPEKASNIAKSGREKVKKFRRDYWAKTIVEISTKLKIPG